MKHRENQVVQWIRRGSAGARPFCSACFFAVFVSFCKQLGLAFLILSSKRRRRKSRGFAEEEAVEYLTVHKDRQAKKKTSLENNLKTHFHLTPDQAEELVLELQNYEF